MDEWDVIIYVIPLLIGGLSAFIPLKTEEKTEDGQLLPLHKRITTFGIILIPIALFYFVAGIINLGHRNAEEKNYHNTIDSLSSNVKEVKSRSETYYQVLVGLGYKLDTTTAQGKRQIDSLITVTKSQRNQLDSTKADLDFCLNDSNLTIKEYNDQESRIIIQVCNGNKRVYDVKILHYAIVANNGFTVIPHKETHYLMNIDGMQKNQELVSSAYIPKQTFSDSIYFFYKGYYIDEQKKRYSFRHIYFKYPNSTKLVIRNKYYTERIETFLKENRIW